MEVSSAGKLGPCVQSIAGLCALPACIEKATKVMARKPRAISSNIRIALYLTIGAAVFLSSCATYGIPDRLPIQENAPQCPINPYERSKLAGEQILWPTRDLRSILARRLRVPVQHAGSWRATMARTSELKLKVLR
jgi:UDP-glucose 4-epimerase